MVRRQIYTQQSEISLFIGGEGAGDGIGAAFAVERVNLDPVRAANDVHISNYLAGADKEPGTTNQRLSLGVVGQHRNDRRLDATDERGQRLLRRCGRGWYRLCLSD